MEAEDRAALAATLKPGRHRWSTLLPSDGGLFYGKRIGILITGDGLGKNKPPSAAAMGLLKLILTHFPKLIGTAEKVSDDEPGDTDKIHNVAKPHIWIHDHALGNDETWTFVIGLRESSLAWHMEFSKTKFREVWAGS